MEDDKVARSGGTRAGAGGPRKLKGQGKKRAGAGLPASVNIADSEEEVAAMEASSTQERPSLAVTLAENDPFNWESYIAGYTNSTRVLRLLFLAEHCPSIRIPCADQALALIQAETANTELYVKALQLRNTDSAIGQLRQSNVKAQDDTWLKQTVASNRNEEEKLEIELRNYQNNQIKESIRVSIHAAPRDFVIHEADIRAAYRWQIATWATSTGEQDTLNWPSSTIKRRESSPRLESTSWKCV